MRVFLIISLVFILTACTSGPKNESSKLDLTSHGIDKSNAHPKAIELMTDEFFWDPVDELAPFGSDEGFTALEEFRNWRKQYPDKKAYDCMKWTIEDVGQMRVENYTIKLASSDLIKSQMKNPNYNAQHFIHTLDISVIATGFSQLVDEGIIEPRNIKIIKVAIQRQKAWTELQENWAPKVEYNRRLDMLNLALDHLSKE